LRRLLSRRLVGDDRQLDKVLPGATRRDVPLRLKDWVTHSYRPPGLRMADDNALPAHEADPRPDEEFTIGYPSGWTISGPRGR
jgi:hypothetical protein